jgi:hypothetical protein
MEAEFGGRLRMTFAGMCMLIAISACEKDEPAALREKITQPQQHQQAPSRPQPNKPNEPIVTGYASPEEAYEMCEQARQQRNWTTVLDCLTEEAQDNALLQLHLALTQLLRIEENASQFGPASLDSTTDDSKEIALRALKTKYAAIDASDNNMSSVVPTKYEYFGEIMDFFSKYGQGKEPKGHSLINVTIEGDRAVGTAVNTYETGKEDSSEIKFKRVSGEWFKDGMVEDL